MTPAAAEAAGVDQDSASITGETVIFVDSSIAGYEALVGPGDGTNVVVLDSSSDAVLQIRDALAGRHGLSAIHIVSHGSAGELRFGGGSLSNDNLATYSQPLADIGASLSETGDLLLYGCYVGAAADGLAFVDALAAATGADIAASNDLTGNAGQGGDWELEVTTGSIEAAVAITADAQNDYAGLLIAPADESFDAEPFDGSFTTSYAVNGFTFTADTSVEFATAASTDSGFDFQLSRDDGAGDKALFVNYDAGVLADGFGFKSTDGSNFKLVSFQIQNVNIGNIGLTVSVLSDGSQVGSGIFNLTTSSASNGISYTHDGVDGSVSGGGGHYGTFTFDSSYQNVDEVRLVFAGALSIGTFALDNIDISPAVTNSAPTISGAPTDVTVTEDVASNVNLSSVTFADADGDSLTATLTVSAGTLAATSGGGVTVSGSGTGMLTLSGTAASINTYLDTASNLQYTGASNANGNNAATLNITPNDGTVNGSAAVVNIDITAVNDNPTASGVPTDVTVTEDVASNLDLSSITLSDVDSGSGSVALILAAASGTLTATSSGGVTVGGSGTGTLTLTGTLPNVDTYLNTASNVKYTGASNANGNDADTLTLTVNDGGNTGSGGGGNVALGTVNIDIIAVNDAPTAIGIPTDITVTEDVASNLDLSAMTLSDVDSGSASVTLTLAASAGTVTASSGGGITVVGSGSGTLTLTGTVSNIDTFLNTASNILYTGTSNTNGNDAATLTLTVNDGGNSGTGGGGNVSLGTINIDIAAVNDDPSATGVPTDVTVTEDVASNLDLSAITLSDVDSGGGSVTLTLTAGSGTLTASSSGGVTVGGIGTGTLTLSGTISNVDTYLNTASNVKYTGASNANGNDADTLTLTVNDGGNSGSGGGGNVALGTVNIDITAVNDEPTLSATGSNPTFTEGGAAASLFSGASVSTVESGQTITGFTFTVTNVVDGSNERLNVDGTTIVLTHGANGTTATNSLSYSVVVVSSTATVSLTGGTMSTATTQTLVNAMSYQNNSNTPNTSNRVVTLTSVTDSGSNTGDNDNVAALAVASTVTVVAVNDEPTLTATGSNPTFTEGGAAASLFSGASVSTVESGQTITGLTFTVTNVADGSSEVANVDGTAVTLTNGNSGTTATNSLSYSVAVSGSTATVSLTGGTMSTAATQTLVNALSYQNNSNDPNISNRVLTLTSITDSGSNTGANDNTAALAVASTVTVTGVNDEPTLSATGSNPTFTEGGAAASLFSGASVSTVESGQTITGLTFTVTNVVDGSNERLNVDGTTIVLTHGTNGTTATNSLSYSVAVFGSTATVTFSGGTTSAAALQTLVNAMSYQNNSNTPNTSNRVVTLTRITDSGGTANGGDDTAILSTTSTVTLVDTPEEVNLSVDVTSGTESDGTVITITATANGAVTGEQTVDIDVSGTGITSADGTLSNALLTIPAGGTSGSVKYTILDDLLVEGSETATFSMSSLSLGLTAGSTTSRTVTITDNDTAIVSFQSDSSATADESTASFPVTVVLTTSPGATLASDVTVNIASADGTATAGVDYTAVNQTLTFTAGSGSTLQTVNVSVQADTDVEGDETLTLTLSSPAAPLSFGSTTTHTVTITDDEYDFGDAPTAAQSGFTSDYPVLDSAMGAKHFNAGPRLGASIDIDANGQPSATADGDGADDDGIQFFTTGNVLLVAAATTTQAAVQVDLQNADALSNRLDAWIDFNRDGDWNDAGEQIFANLDLGTTDGAQTLTFTLPAGASTGTTYARFRLSTSGGLLPTGAAADGEVEDYQLTLLAVDGAAVTINPSGGPVNLSQSGSDAVLTDSDDNVLLRIPDGQLGTLTIAASVTVTGAGLSTVADRVSVDGDVTFNSSSSLVGVVNGTNAGTDHHQLQVTGAARTVSLAGAELSLTAGTTLNTGDTLVIVDLADAGSTLSGTFNGLSEGAAVSFGSNRGSISYQSGDGNDVVITVDNTAPEVTSFARNTPATSSTSEDTLVFSITFSEDVINVTADDFEISGTTATGALTGSGSNYTLTVAGGDLADLNGSVELNLNATQDIIDLAGNALASGEPATDESYSVSNSSGPLELTLPDGDGNYELLRDGDDLVLRVAGGGEVVRKSVALITELIIHSTAGADSVTVLNSGPTVSTPLMFNSGDGDDMFDGRLGTGPMTLIGGVGDDVLTGGSGLNQIFGGPGNDRLTGGSASDLLVGGEGHDTLLGGDGRDVIFGEAGDDRIEGGADSDFIRGGGGKDFVTGGQGNDRIRGEGGDDTLEGGAGSDLLDGGSGNDSLLGLRGRDILNGGIGDDRLRGGIGNDLLLGGDGRDVLLGEADHDHLEGGADSDLIRGGDGDDVAFGGDGNDTIRGEDGDDTLDGGAGSDLLDGGADDDSLLGVNGRDTLTGASGNDMLIGGFGNDSLDGGTGLDTLLGEAGDDVLATAGDDDSLDGGDGADTINGILESALPMALDTLLGGA